MVKSHSCASCHSADGTSLSGPTWKGLAGSQVQLKDGSTVVADDEYLHRSIADPDAQIRAGYNAGSMSALMRNQNKLTDDEITQIVAYLDTLR